MTDPIISDRATLSAQLALDGLAKRQEVIGRNLANVDTPGYQAQTINFEHALAQALEDRQPVSLQVTQAGHMQFSSREPAIRLAPRLGGSQRADGNNVDVDVELNQMAETGIRYQAITQLISKKFMLLRTIANSR